MFLNLHGSGPLSLAMDHECSFLPSRTAYSVALSEEKWTA